MTAVLTITCPHCGGWIENVRSTDSEQTIPCPFCRIDLHIPRVGTERITHEVIREIEPINSAGLLKPKLSTGGRFLLALGLFAAMLCMVGLMHCSATATIDRMDSCEASCTSQCASAGDQEPPDREGEIATHDLMADADRVLCESRCEQAAKCWSR